MVRKLVLFAVTIVAFCGNSSGFASGVSVATFDYVNISNGLDGVESANTFTVGSQGGIVYAKYRDQIPNIQITRSTLGKNAQVVFGISTRPATFYPKRGAVTSGFNTNRIVPIGPLLSLTLSAEAIGLDITSDSSALTVRDALIFTPAFYQDKIGSDIEVGAELRVKYNNERQIFLGVIPSSLEESVVVYNTQILRALKDTDTSTITVTLQPVDISKAHKQLKNSP